MYRHVLSVGLSTLTILCTVANQEVCQIASGCSLCTCWHSEWYHGTYVDCFDRKLTCIPHSLPNDTVFLNFNKNPIKILKNMSMSNLRDLRVLTIQDTLLNDIEIGAFEGLDGLHHLDLSRNLYFGVYDNNLKPGIFHPLSGLRSLYLNHGVRSIDVYKNYTYPMDVLKNLHKLETLKIDGLRNRIGPGLEHLRKLSLSGFDGACNIGQLGGSYLSNMPQLIELELMKCAIRDIDKNAFMPLQKLTKLNLSYNRVGFPTFFNASCGLSRQIRYLDISYIYSTFGDSKKLLIEYVKCLKHSRLKILKISGNRLELLQYGLLSYHTPQHLSYVIARDNRFVYDDYVLEIGELKQLIHIDLSYQHVSHPLLPDHMFLSQDNKSNISLTGTYSESYVFPVPPALRILTCRYCRAPGIIQTSFAIGPNKLSYIDISNNGLTEWYASVSGVKGVWFFNASYNYCTNMSINFFDNFINLRVLILDYNYFGRFLGQDPEGRTFENLGSLQTLSLERNMINFLHIDIFRALTSLTVLNLSRNELVNFGTRVDVLPQLGHLVLSDNHITYITANTTREFDTRRKVLTIYIHNNYLQCSCDSLPFLGWLENHSSNVKITGYKHSKCPTEMWKFADLATITEVLSVRCRDIDVFLLIASIGIIVTAIAIAVAVVHRYRWKLRYFYYVSKAKYRGFTKGNQNEFPYDVFISYAQEDALFVKDELDPKLHNEAGLKLFIHDRDFIGGEYIRDNIARAVYKSRKTLVLLTEDYIKSYWCTFEFHMARMEETHREDDVVVLCNYRYVPPKLMPPEIAEHMESVTYITYPCRPIESEKTLFWKNLRKALEIDQ